MENFEYKTVGVPARMGAQSRELNKWAKRGWECTDVRHMFAAGRARAYLRRPVADPAPNQAADAINQGADWLDRLNTKMATWTAKQRIVNDKAAADRRAAKAAHKSGKATP